MIGGIGRFRDIGNPFDPRRARSLPTPAAANLSGLPSGNAENILSVLRSSLPDYGENPVPGSRRDKIQRIADGLQNAEEGVYGGGVEYKQRPESSYTIGRSQPSPDPGSGTWNLESKEPWHQRINRTRAVPRGIETVGTEFTPQQYPGERAQYRGATAADREDVRNEVLPTERISSPEIKGTRLTDEIAYQAVRPPYRSKDKTIYSTRAGSRWSTESPEANAPQKGIGPLLRGEKAAVQMVDPAISKERRLRRKPSTAARGIANVDAIVGVRDADTSPYSQIPSAEARQILDQYASGMVYNPEVDIPDLSRLAVVDKKRSEVYGVSDRSEILRERGYLPRQDTPELAAYGRIPVNVRGRDTQIGGIVEIDPREVVETRLVDPDNVTPWEREKEITRGDIAKEARSDTKTPVIGESALNLELILKDDDGEIVKGRAQVFETPEGRAKLAQRFYEMGILQDNKVGSLVGFINQTRAVRTPGGVKEVVVPLPLFAPTEGGRRVTGRKDVPFGDYSSQTTTEPIYRIGNPQSRDKDELRRQVAEAMPMQTMRRLRREGEPKVRGGAKAKGRISIAEVKSAMEQGYTFERANEDGSVALMTRPGSDKKVLLLRDANTGDFIVTDAYAGGKRYETGPAVALTQEFKGERVPERVGGIRQRAEELPGGIQIEDFVDEVAKGSFMEDPADSSHERVAARALANALRTGKMAGPGGKLVDVDPQRIWEIVKRNPELVVQNLREGSGQSRRVDLFQEPEIDRTILERLGLIDPATQQRASAQGMLDPGDISVEDSVDSRIRAASQSGTSEGDDLRGGDQNWDLVRNQEKERGYRVESVETERPDDPLAPALALASQITPNPQEAEYLARLAVNENWARVERGLGSDLPGVMQRIARPQQAVLSEMASNQPESIKKGVPNTSTVSALNAPASQPVAPGAGIVGMENIPEGVPAAVIRGLQSAQGSPAYIGAMKWMADYGPGVQR